MGEFGGFGGLCAFLLRSAFASLKTVWARNQGFRPFLRIPCPHKFLWGRSTFRCLVLGPGSRRTLGATCCTLASLGLGLGLLLRALGHLCLLLEALSDAGSEMISVETSSSCTL